MPRVGATGVNRAMAQTAIGGHKTIVQLCLDLGATKNDMVAYAARGGHEAVVRLCLEWDAKRGDELKI